MSCGSSKQQALFGGTVQSGVAAPGKALTCSVLYIFFLGYFFNTSLLQNINMGHWRTCGTGTFNIS